MSDLKYLPVLRVFDRIGIRRLLGIGAIFVLLGAYYLTISVYRPDLASPTNIGGDPSNYLAAGERLAVGHSLYHLSPGDRPVGQDNPPLWTVAFLYPPATAMVWRILTLLPGGPVMTVWWLGGFASTITFIVILVLGGSRTSLVLSAALAFPLAVTGLSGNVNAYFVLLFALVWHLTRERSSAKSRVIAGLMVGVAAAIKVTPVLLLVWLLVRRERVASSWAILSATALVVAGVVTAGWATTVEYIEISRTTSLSGATPLSVLGLLRSLDLPDAVAPFVTPVSALVFCALIVLLRGRSGIAFFIAVVGIVAVSPVVRAETIAVALAGLSPWVSIRSRQQVRGSPPGPLGSVP